VVRYAWDNDPVPWFNVLHRLTYFLHDAYAFVAEHPGRRCTTEYTVVDMQIGAADGSGSESNEDIF
jgi:hypothetical protein